MTIFILVATLITLIALFILVRPLLTTRDTFSYTRQAQNIHYAKERLAELEEQLKNSSISATDYEALKMEIESTLAQDIDLSKAGNTENSTPAQTKKTRSNWPLIAALALFIPLSGFGFYLITGTPDALTEHQKNVKAKTDNVTSAQTDQIKQLVNSLQAKLNEQPNNPEGWVLLARTYLTLGEFDQAIISLKKSLALGFETSNVYALLADATGLKNGGLLQGVPTEYANKALQLDPHNQQALWLAGLAAVQDGRTELARKHWQTLDNLLADQPQNQKELREIMRDAFAAAPGSLTVDNANDTQPTSQNQSPLVASEVSLTVQVTLDPALKNKVSANDTVFVFARAQNGPPAPLAVKRLTVADLPTTLTLSDDDAMVPEFRLSLFTHIEVQARVSKSGQPKAQTGDLQSSLIQTSNTEPASLNLVINSVVE